MNLNRIRNSAIDKSIKLLKQAKAKPTPASTELKHLLDNPELSNADKIKALNFVAKQIKETQDA